MSLSDGIDASKFNLGISNSKTPRLLGVLQDKIENEVLTQMRSEYNTKCSVEFTKHNDDAFATIFVEPDPLANLYGDDASRCGSGYSSFGVEIGLVEDLEKRIRDLVEILESTSDTVVIARTRSL